MLEGSNKVYPLTIKEYIKRIYVLRMKLQYPLSKWVHVIICSGCSITHFRNLGGIP